MTPSPLIQKVKGHKAQKENLLRIVSESRFPQSTMFVGPRGVGKYLMARSVAQALVCESTSGPCGQCGPCIRIDKNQSESLLVIQPEKTGIKVEQARQVVHFVNYQASGKAKVVIIDDAEWLNPQAANALLKTIEEPPPKTHFIIVAASASAVLPTIRSRLQTVRFGPLSEEELCPKDSVPTWVIKSARGRLDKLLELSEKENLDLRRESFRLFESTLSGQLSSSFPELKDAVKEKDVAPQILAYWQQFLRDIMVLKVDPGKVVHTDLIRSYEKFTHIDSTDLDDVFYRTVQMERDLKGFVDRTLCFEDLWLKSHNRFNKRLKGHNKFSKRLKSHNTFRDS